MVKKTFTDSGVPQEIAHDIADTCQCVIDSVGPTNVGHLSLGAIGFMEKNMPHQRFLPPLIRQRLFDAPGNPAWRNVGCACEEEMLRLELQEV